MAGGLMMEFRSIPWAGVGVTDFEAGVRFYAEVMGFALTLRDDERQVALFRSTSGDLFELFGPNNESKALHEKPTFAFEVDDVEAARRQLAEKGVALVTEIREWEDERWCYFRGPDGLLFEILEKGERNE